jgi:hypothetical protein
MNQHNSDKLILNIFDIIAAIMHIICIKQDMCILLVSPYPPHVLNEHQIGSGRQMR